MGFRRVPGRLVVVVGHPLRVDVQLQGLHRARPAEQRREFPDVQRRAVDEDDPAVLGDAEPGTPHVVAAAEGGAPGGVHVLIHRGRDLPVVDQELEVLPDADHVRGHPQLAAPGTDLDGAVAVVDHRRRPVHQGALVRAVEVEAAARRVQLEPAVEGGQQALAGARRDPRRGLPVARARVFGARPQPELDQPLVHRDEARHVGGVHRARPQERAEDGRVALDRLQHPPGALAGQRMAGRGGELVPGCSARSRACACRSWRRASPDGAASEKPGLPPALGGLYEIHSPNVTTGPR